MAKYVKNDSIHVENFQERHFLRITKNNVKRHRGGGKIWWILGYRRGVSEGVLWYRDGKIHLIASRSPPSHDPKLLSFFRICPLPGTHFYHFGLPFGVTFASLGPLVEHFGYTFWAKKRPEAPEVPPEVPKGDFPRKV